MSNNPKFCIELLMVNACLSQIKIKSYKYFFLLFYFPLYPQLLGNIYLKYCFVKYFYIPQMEAFIESCMFCDDKCRFSLCENKII